MGEWTRAPNLARGAAYMNNQLQHLKMYDVALERLTEAKVFNFEITDRATIAEHRKLIVEYEEVDLLIGEFVLEVLGLAGPHVRGGVRRAPALRELGDDIRARGEGKLPELGNAHIRIVLAPGEGHGHNGSAFLFICCVYWQMQSPVRYIGRIGRIRPIGQISEITAARSK